MTRVVELCLFFVSMIIFATVVGIFATRVPQSEIQKNFKRENLLDLGMVRSLSDSEVPSVSIPPCPLSIVVTACIFSGDRNRVCEYLNGIFRIIEWARFYKFNVYIVENNGRRVTFLDSIPYMFDYVNCHILYTENNRMNTNNKGIKELQDVKDVIKFYNLSDNELIIKVTGRYLLNTVSCAFLSNLSSDMDAIVKFGSYLDPQNIQMLDCITGIIGMRVQYIKQIETPEENECVEWKWAKCTYNIPKERVRVVIGNVGLYLNPNGQPGYMLI